MSYFQAQGDYKTKKENLIKFTEILTEIFRIYLQCRVDTQAASVKNVWDWKIW